MNYVFYASLGVLHHSISIETFQAFLILVRISNPTKSRTSFDYLLDFVGFEIQTKLRKTRSDKMSL